MSIRRASKSSISTTSRGKGSNFLAGYSPAVDEMDLIARVTVGAGGAAAIEFTSIPATYQHLQIRALTRTDRASSGDQLRMQFNGDTGANYSVHELYTLGAAAEVSVTRMFVDSGAGGTSASGVFGGGIIDILDYASGSKNPVMRAFGGFDSNTAGFVAIASGMRMNTAAVSSIKLFGIGNTFAQYSTASLYGVIG